MKPTALSHQKQGLALSASAGTVESKGSAAPFSQENLLEDVRAEIFSTVR